MLSWLNTKISGITDLTHDFVDGSNLIRLYEACTEKDFPIQWRSTPRTVHENRLNIGALVTFLENTRRLKSGLISKEDILWGDLRATYALLRRMNIALDRGNLPPLTFSKKEDEPESPTDEEDWVGKMVELSEEEFPSRMGVKQVKRRQAEEEDEREETIEVVETTEEDESDGREVSSERYELEIEEKTIEDDTVEGSSSQEKVSANGKSSSPTQKPVEPSENDRADSSPRQEKVSAKGKRLFEKQESLEPIDDDRAELGLSQKQLSANGKRLCEPQKSIEPIDDDREEGGMGRKKLSANRKSSFQGQQSIEPIDDDRDERGMGHKKLSANRKGSFEGQQSIESIDDDRDESRIDHKKLSANGPNSFEAEKSHEPIDDDRIRSRSNQKKLTANGQNAFEAEKSHGPIDDDRDENGIGHKTLSASGQNAFEAQQSIDPIDGDRNRSPSNQKTLSANGQNSFDAQQSIDPIDDDRTRSPSNQKALSANGHNSFDTQQSIDPIDDDRDDSRISQKQPSANGKSSFEAQQSIDPIDDDRDESRIDHQTLSANGQNSFEAEKSHAPIADDRTRSPSNQKNLSANGQHSFEAQTSDELLDDDTPRSPSNAKNSSARNRHSFETLELQACEQPGDQTHTAESGIAWLTPEQFEDGCSYSQPPVQGSIISLYSAREAELDDDVVPLAGSSFAPVSLADLSNLKVSDRPQQFMKPPPQQGMASTLPALKPDSVLPVKEPEGSSSRPRSRASSQAEKTTTTTGLPPVGHRGPNSPTQRRETSGLSAQSDPPSSPSQRSRRPSRNPSQLSGGSPTIDDEEGPKSRPPPVDVRPNSQTKGSPSSPLSQLADESATFEVRANARSGPMSPPASTTRPSSRAPELPSLENREASKSGSSLAEPLPTSQTERLPALVLPNLGSPANEQGKTSKSESSPTDVLLGCQPDSPVSKRGAPADKPGQADPNNAALNRWLSEPGHSTADIALQPPPGWEVSDHPNQDHGFISKGDITAPIRPAGLRHLPRSTQAVGIDLGTQSCRYGILTDSQVSDKDDTLQGVIAFHGEQRTIGMVPGDVSDRDDTVVVKDLQRMLGRDFENQPDFNDQPLESDPETGRPVVRVGDQKYTAEELVGMVLSTVRERVATTTGENVVDAVLTVPGFCANAQRQATIDAGRVAGLNVIRIVSATAAAAVAFNAHNPSDERRNIVVFDLGAGKLDVSLIELDGGECNVIKTSGSASLGGSDIDDLLFRHFAADLGDLRESKAACRKLRDDCESAKIALSSQSSTQLLNREFTRAEFEHICEEFFARCIDPLFDIFTEQAIGKSDISTVLLVGGSTKIPRLRHLIADFFGNTTELFDAEANDVAVVEGAAIQAAIMKGTVTGVSIRNSTPLSLGISLANGINHILLPRGSTLPTHFLTKATTFRDNQPNVGFDVIEGERPLARDCIKLGHVIVEGIELARRGVPRIMVKMMLNEDGILCVTANDIRTGVVVSAQIENRGNLPREAVERLVAEAEEERSKDPNLRAREEAKFKLGFFLQRAKVAFRSEIKKRKVASADREKCRHALVTCKKWLAAHQKERPQVYADKFEVVRKIVNQVVVVI